MSNRERLGVSHSSFLDVTGTRATASKILNYGFQRREDEFFGTAVRAVRGGFLMPDVSLGHLSVKEARAISIIEAATLFFTYPQLTNSQMNSFFSLYRLLRTLELSSGFQRGGDALLVGSAHTIPEMLALHINPPSASLIAELGRDNLKEVISEKMRNLLYRKLESPPLLNGQIIAFDPLLRREHEFQFVEKLRKDFGIPDGKLTILPETIADVLGRKEQYAGMFDVVLWHRAEPKIVVGSDTTLRKGGKQKREARKTQREVFDGFMDILKTGGHFFISVGEGNEVPELNDRKRLINDFIQFFRGQGIISVPGVPAFFDSPNMKNAFGGLGFGMVGWALARK